MAAERTEVCLQMMPQVRSAAEWLPSGRAGIVAGSTPMGFRVPASRF